MQDLNYNNNLLLTDLENLTVLSQKVDKLSDNELVPANIVKRLVAAIAGYVTSNGKSDSEILGELMHWQGTLVQPLTYTDKDADKKALSVAAGQELQKAINAIQIADVKELATQITQLKQQVSYLISCLTVEKVSNEDYRDVENQEPLIEYYTVGLADFAFDADTKFKLITNEGEN